MYPLNQGIPYACTGHPYELVQQRGVINYTRGLLSVEDESGQTHQQLFYAKSPEADLIVKAYQDTHLVTLTGLRMGRKHTDALHVKTVTNIHVPPRYRVGTTTHFCWSDKSLTMFGKISFSEYQQDFERWAYVIETTFGKVVVHEEDIDRFWMTVEGKLDQRNG